MADKKAMHDLKNSKAIPDLDPNDYDVIFMAGGWGAAYDLMQSEDDVGLHHPRQRGRARSLGRCATAHWGFAVPRGWTVNRWSRAAASPA